MVLVVNVNKLSSNMAEKFENYYGIATRSNKRDIKPVEVMSHYTCIIQTVRKKLVWQQTRQVKDNHGKCLSLDCSLELNPGNTRLSVKIFKGSVFTEK